MNGPEVMAAVAAITVLGVFGLLGAADMVADWRQRREVRRLERRAASRRQLSRPRSLP